MKHITLRTHRRLMRRLLACLVAVGAGSVTPAVAQGPFGGPSYSGSRAFGGGSPVGRGAMGNHPTYSPYLNLLREDSSTLQNYYGLVRPEQQFRTDTQKLNQQLGEVRSEQRESQQEMAGSRLRSSGHHARFQSGLSGGPSSIVQSLSERRPSQTDGRGNSRLAWTGHSAYFGNTAYFYQGVNGDVPLGSGAQLSSSSLAGGSSGLQSFNPGARPGSVPQQGGGATQGATRPNTGPRPSPTAGMSSGR